jgi:hypothetical protein
VQEILQLKPTTFATIFKYIEENMSPDDIFGNLVPTVNRIKNSIQIHSKRPKRYRVRYPKRKRGYTDKGTLRFPHEIHQDWTFSGPNPEREDYRMMISTPRRGSKWTGAD